MKKNNLFDFLIILLFTIAVMAFPFNLFTEDNTIILILQIVAQVALFFINLVYIKKFTNLTISLGKTNYKNVLILLPTFLVCFSNYLYLGVGTKIVSFVFDFNLVLEIILALGVAINEETVFRLVLLNNINNENKIIKIVISAAVFGLCHITAFLSTLDPQNLLKVLYTFLLGLLLGYFYLFTKSFPFTILLHFFFNTFNQVLVGHMGTIETDFMTYILLNGVVALVVAIYVVFIYFRYRKKEQF